MGKKNKKQAVKFKHGAAYSFKVNGKVVHGLYNEDEVGYEFEAIDRYYNLSNCTNIVRLISDS